MHAISGARRAMRTDARDQGAKRTVPLRFIQLEIQQLVQNTGSDKSGALDFEPALEMRTQMDCFQVSVRGLPTTNCFYILTNSF
jgi:hypothetical protein